MADNVTTQSTTLATVPTATTIATDNIGGINYQRVKPAFGIDGVATDVSSTDPLPVTLANTGANATAVKVDNSAVTQPTNVTQVAGAAIAQGHGLAATAVRVELPTDGTGVLAGITNVVHVDDNASSLTVDQSVAANLNATVVGTGTFAVQATQAGTWNITNISGTITLPTGAATSAKQPALGTAGTASADVITVQGIASMTALKVDGSGVTQPVNNAGTFAVQSASATAPVATMNSASANSGVNSAIAAVFDDAAPTSITEDSFGFVRMSANRNVYTTIRDASGSERGANVNASNQLAIAGPVTVASGGIASGAVASGAVASGAFASGALSSGSVAAGAFASGALASGSIAAGAIATGATSIAANEDDASANLDTGVKVLVVQKATPANTAGSDGDYEMLQISGGKLWTNNVGNFVTVSTDVTRPADTNIYAINDALSDSTSAPTSGGFTFTNAARISGGSGIITDAIITSSNDATTTLQGEIWIFNTSVTNINDNTAFAVSDSEIKTCIGKIPFVLEDAGNNDFASVQGLGIGFTASGSANLRFLIRVKNAYTPASSEVITVVLKIVQTN